MKEIVNSNSFALQVLGEQGIDFSKKYRLFKYVKTTEYENSVILFNMITGEIISYNKSEYELLNRNISEKEFNEDVKRLIKKWFFVTENNDDLKLLKQFENTLSAINSIYSNSDITSYTILTTTDCNARCFYCYQHGCNHKTMTAKTANDTADYIIKHSSGNAIHLRWFGGEPLFNSEAIDIITNKLIENNIDFSSVMTSNAYLFDDKLIKKAVDIWKLKSIQITLDGTEDVYNRVKNYIYKDEKSSFKRVTDNIEKLLTDGVAVKIRLNMDKHNSEDLFRLADYLVERYVQYDNLSVYAHLLYDDSCKAVENRTAQEKADLSVLCDRLNQKFKDMQKSGLHKEFSFKLRKHCMSDTDSAVMILPDGKLGKCEHYLDSGFIGDIYNGITDLTVFKNYKVVRAVCEKCEDCMYRIACSGVASCPNHRKSCDDFDKQQVEKGLEKRMIDEYLLNTK